MPRLALILISYLFCLQAIALQLPEELEGWQEWVLHNAKQHHCPFLTGVDGRACVWPGRFELEVTDSGASFSLQAEIYARSWLPLPGDDFYWPTNLSVNDKAVALSEANGLPGVWLAPGSYLLKGQFTWKQVPSALKLPKSYALIKLNLGGKAMANPVRDQAGKVLLQRSRVKKGDRERDHVNVQVYRLLKDGNPFIIETLVALDVTGAERELILGKILPSNFTPLDFSSPLPARIESDGNLRIQVKPGRYQVSLQSYENKALQSIDHRGAAEYWPQQEIWFFQADRRFRTVQIEGASTMDASQLELDKDWYEFPAYLVGQDAEFRMREIYRGDPNPPGNQLSINKQIWLASTGDEFTVRDSISGQMFRRWRLEADANYTLGSVELDAEPQLITQLNAESLPGVEIRSQQIDLEATSKLSKGSSMPVSGWNAEFKKVNTTLHLPPAWSVFSVSGADSVSGSWMSRWNLWDIFLVLIVAVSIGRVLHPLGGLLAFAMLLVSYQREGAPGVVLIFITAALALLPYVKNRLAMLLSGVLALLFVVVLAGFLPFILEQVRSAVYPQLEHENTALGQVAHSPTRPENIVLQDDYMESHAEPDLVQNLPQVSSRASKVEEMVVSGARKQRKYANDYDASQVLQAGPGIPDWTWNSVSMSWSGPVVAEEETRMILVPPLFNRIGNLLSVILVAAVIFILLRHTLRLKPWQNFSSASAKSLANSSAVICLGSALFIGSLAGSNTVSAEVLVDKALLETLEKRLLEKPKCVPHCASIESLRISAQSKNLLIQIRAHASANLAFPLPANTRQWWPVSVAINGKEAKALVTRKGKLYVNLPQGSHSISLIGDLSAKENLNLEFQLPLHNVTADVDGWELSGLPTKNRSSQNISLTRAFRINKNQAESRLVPESISPFVKVERTIELRRRWTVETRVLRIAPSTGAINLKVPLLDGESPISGDTHIDSESKQAFMDVRLGPNQSHFSWQGVMEVGKKFSLIAAQTKQWTEQWRVDTSPLWHSEYAGLPTVQSDNSSVSPTWLPWPGERVDFTVYEPLSVVGEKLAIDAIKLRHSPASRLSDSYLELTMRATQGGEFDFTLPEGADFKSLRIDGKETPISHRDSKLKIPLSPGEQQVTIHWQHRGKLGFKISSPPLELGHAASNIRIHMNLPRDRWILALGGPQIGPAVLFWSVLLVIVVVAFALSRSKLTPLKSYEWILLSFGVVSLSLVALVVIALWFIAINQRSKLVSRVPLQYFNYMQVGFFFFSLLALLCLVVSIPNSLLSLPDMYIQGNRSYASNLNWFQGEISSAMPQAWVISVPVYVYRITMLLWSLWLAFSLMAWIRWAWVQLGIEAYWRDSKDLKKGNKVTNTKASTKEEN